MTYEETLAYLYEQLPMYSRIGAAAYKKDLHNIKALCAALGDPQDKIRCIHVAGTNGKGSTSHMLAAVLQEAGFKTGLYTSPHIKHFGERIRVNGEMIKESFVIDFVARIKNIAEQVAPSFFELSVAMAFEYFVQENVDIAVIEVGLGGRLDSTNIITPLLSVITNIGFDHMDILGHTLEEIATEKAGIIKPGIPTVIGEAIKESRPVFIQRAKEIKAPLHFAEDKYLITYIDPEGGLLLCNIKNVETDIVEKLRLDLTGVYQTKNARTVLCTVDMLRKLGMEIPEKALHDGLENVKKITGLHGRWEITETDPVVIIEAAHNKDGIIQVITQLENDYPGANYHFILGFVNDKDISGILPLFPAAAKYYFTNAHIPRALSHETLKQMAATAGLSGDSYDDVNTALVHAKTAAAKEDIIIACGSFFILGEIV